MLVKPGERRLRLRFDDGVEGEVESGAFSHSSPIVYRMNIV